MRTNIHYRTAYYITNIQYRKMNRKFEIEKSHLPQAIIVTDLKIEREMSNLMYYLRTCYHLAF